MKKKMIAAVIACSMVVTSIPSLAFANEEAVSVETNASPTMEMLESEIEAEEPDAIPEEEMEQEEPIEAEATAETEEMTADPEVNADSETETESPVMEEAETGAQVKAMSMASGTSKLSATPISMASGSKVTGTFTSNNVEHWYTFTLNDTRRFRVHYDYEGASSSYAYLYAAANTNSWIFCTSGGNDRFTYLGAGTYYLKIKPSYFTDRYQPMNYTFNVISNQSVKDEISEPNDNITSAAELKSDKKYYGALVKVDSNLKADADYVCYNVAKGKYRLNVNVPEALTYGGSGGQPAGSIEIYALDAYGNKREVFNVNGYNRRYVQLKSGAKGSFTVNMPQGATYLQVVYGGIDNVIGQYSLELVKMPGNTSNLKLKAAGSKSLKVTCKAASNKTGYEVTYKKKNSGKWTKKRFAKNSFTLKKLKKKTTYVVKVRTYRIVNGTTYYSSWTSAKVKRTK